MALASSSTVKASSLLEVVVAMVLIVAVFGISMVIYLNVSRTSFSRQQVHGSLLISEVAARTLENKSFFDEVIEKDQLIIHKKVSRYSQSAHLLLLEVEAHTRNNQLLGKHKQLIRDEQDR